MDELHDGTAPALIAGAEAGSLRDLAMLYAKCAAWVENYGQFPPEVRGWIACRLVGIAPTKKRQQLQLIECGAGALLGYVPEVQRGWLARSLRELSHAVADRTVVENGIERKLPVARDVIRPHPGGDRLRIPRGKLEDDLARAIGLQREGEGGSRTRTESRDRLIAETACALLVFPSERFRQFRKGRKISRSNAVDFAIEVANSAVVISHSTADAAWITRLRQLVLELARERGLSAEAMRANGVTERTVSDIVGSDN